MTIKTDGFHHVAYRCRDAKETVEFYQTHLGMDFQLAIAEDHVPSTGAYDPYMHIFLDAGNNNVLAFFELPEQPDMDRDRNTPEWVQHIALRVGSLDELLAATEQMTQLKDVAPAMLAEWSETKKAPRHAAWLHEKIQNES